MKVFFSYSRQDEAIAHLLAHILNTYRIECLIDRQLLPARRFDEDLQAMIKRADVVLVLWSETASSSPWVNQEIGFAVALEKPIWPIALQETIQPSGMLSSVQSYSLFDWSDPSRTIDQLVSTLLRTGESPGFRDHYRELQLDQVISGKEARTRFIITKLHCLLSRSNCQRKVFAQAAFSTFAVSPDPMYRNAGGHSEEYMDLLLAERRLFDELVRREDTAFKMIVWPVRAYDERFMSIRYQNLIGWLKSGLGDPTISLACAEYIGPNRFIVLGDPDGDLCIEGYKLHHTSGYELTTVKYSEEKVAEAVCDFERVFEQAVSGGYFGEGAIRRVEKLWARSGE